MPNVIEKTLVLSKNLICYEELDGHEGDTPWVCVEFLKKELGTYSLTNKIVVRASDEPFVGSCRYEISGFICHEILYFRVNTHPTYHSIQTLLENWGYTKRVIAEQSVPLYVRFSDFE